MLGGRRQLLEVLRIQLHNFAGLWSCHFVIGSVIFTTGQLVVKPVAKGFFGAGASVSELYISEDLTRVNILDAGGSRAVKILQSRITRDTILGADFLVLCAIKRGNLSAPLGII